MSWKGIEIIIEATYGGYNKLEQLLGEDIGWNLELLPKEYLDMFADSCFLWDNQFLMGNWVDKRYHEHFDGDECLDDLLVHLPVILYALSEVQLISPYMLLSRGWASVTGATFDNRLQTAKRIYKSGLAHLKQYVKRDPIFRQPVRLMGAA